VTQNNRKKHYTRNHGKANNLKWMLYRRPRKPHNHHAEFIKYHSYFKILRPLLLLSNVVIWYLIFKYVGFKAIIAVFFTLFIIIKGIIEIFFLWRIEKRIFKPIDKLKSGVEEIAKGNYNVKVEIEDINAITGLIDAFNDMAEKLQKSENMKLQYEENRKTLIANISHDLKTPITSIQGYIEYMLEGRAMSQENINKYLHTIYSNSVYINKLIDDLFLFSKLDMQKLDFNFESLNVKAFMEDLMGEFKIELEDKGVEFKYLDLLDKDCSANIDRKRLYQVFRNIISNAVKFGPTSKLSIIIELLRSENYIFITIKDNGIGISADKLPFVFNRFYRIDIERTKDFTGTGLGLAIAKELVEAHGGGIKASSIEMKGTTFTITLPILTDGGTVL
jgi:signal transduction histidine kinase